MIAAFRFRVLFNGLEGVTGMDSMFQSVSGIHGTLQHAAAITVEPVRKENTTIFQPVVLRRAVVPAQHSSLRQWVLTCLNMPSPKPLKSIQVEILNEAQEPILTVRLGNVAVRSWALSDLHADFSNLLMEEIQLEYQSIDLHQADGN